MSLPLAVTHHATLKTGTTHTAGTAQSIDAARPGAVQFSSVLNAMVSQTDGYARSTAQQQRNGAMLIAQFESLRP
jgi:hypothetical protein